MPQKFLHRKQHFANWGGEDGIVEVVHKKWFSCGYASISCLLWKLPTTLDSVSEAPLRQTQTHLKKLLADHALMQCIASKIRSRLYSFTWKLEPDMVLLTHVWPRSLASLCAALNFTNNFGAACQVPSLMEKPTLLTSGFNALNNLRRKQRLTRHIKVSRWLSHSWDARHNWVNLSTVDTCMPVRRLLLETTGTCLGAKPPLGVQHPPVHQPPLQAPPSSEASPRHKETVPSVS